MLQKPKDVRTAELILWAWTAWVSLYGIIYTYSHAPQLAQSIIDQTQGLVALDPDDIRPVAIGGYTFIAILSGWFVFKLGHGKHWARSSFLWSFVLQALTTLAPPYHPLMEYMSDIPDLGLQAFAMVLLYKWQSTEWFNHVDPQKKPIKS